MPRIRSSEAPSTEMLSRLNRHFAGCAAVIAGVMVIGATATSSEASVVTTTTTATTNTPVADPLSGGGYYNSGGLYVDFVDGTTSSTGAAPAKSGSATTGAPSWNVHLFSSTYSGYHYVFAETAQIFAANGNAAGQYANIVDNSGTAALLAPGAVVGPASIFGNNRHEELEGPFQSVANWGPSSSGYLGVEFLDSAGALHYGWINVTLGATYPESITVTQFAYETTPGLAITIPTAVPEPASLGLLTMGALALGARRRRAR